MRRIALGGIALAVFLVAHTVSVKADDGPPDGSPPITEERPKRTTSKPHLQICSGTTIETRAFLHVTNSEHHVADPKHAYTIWPGQPDLINDCSRNYCIDGKAAGATFTHHGGQATVVWQTRCVATENVDHPCQAEIFSANIKQPMVAFHDPAGDSDHWHGRVLGLPAIVADWGQSCIFTGSLPNIVMQYKCVTTISAQPSASGDHIAYSLSYGANHLSDSAVSFGVGVAAGPVFGMASFNPNTTNAQYSSWHGWESRMACKPDGNPKELENYIMDTWVPVYVSTMDRGGGATDEVGQFDPPQIN